MMDRVPRHPAHHRSDQALQSFCAGPAEFTALDVLKAVQVSLNAPLTNVPSAKTTRMMIAAIAATSRPYSTADAPSSSLRLSSRLRRYFVMPMALPPVLLDPPRAPPHCDSRQRRLSAE